jgi:cholesterol transport system auxiliary component
MKGSAMVHRHASRPRRAGLAAALAFAAALAACSVLPPRETYQVWAPTEAASTGAVQSPAPDFSLRVDTPNTTGVLGDNSIVVMPQPGQVSVYKGARWSEPPALLVRQRLVDAFMAAKLPVVTTDDDHIATDYALSGDLRAFQSEYRGGTPTVVVRLDAQLRRAHSRNALAARSFVVTREPAGTQVPDVVSAFGEADDQLAKQVVAWTLDVAGRDRQSAPSPEAADPGSH